MNKKMLTVLFTMLLAVLLAVSTFAAEGKTVYVQSGANGDGSAEAPVGTFMQAIDALQQQGGTVVLLGPVSVRSDVTVPEQAGDLTVTAAENGRLVIDGCIVTFAKNSNDNVITLDAPLTTGADGITVYGGFNSVHFTENFVVNGVVNFFGGVDAPLAPSNTSNGYVEEKTEMNAFANTELPYTITVDGGNFGLFSGGNNRRSAGRTIGSIAAELTVVINGGTFTNAVSHGANSALKIDHAFSLSGMSFLADKATLTVNGGVFNTPIYAQGYIDETTTTASAASMITKSDAKYYAADGDIAITLNGGTFNGCEISAEQTAASYNRVLRGNYTVTVGADVVLADGLVFDATQVKAYEGSDAKAVLVSAQDVNYKRFDVVNGEAKTYEEPIRIACVGDSITQGTSAYVNGVVNYEEYAYPAQLYAKAVAAGKDVIISNYGCGATKVMDYSGLWYNAGLAYVLSMEETDADYIVVGLGTNDASTAANAHGTAMKFKDEYEQFIGGYEALPNTKTVFGTSALYRYRADAAAVGVIRALQEDVLNAMQAEGKKTQYIDLYALTLDAALSGKLLYTDALHPDAEGYTIYADKIFGAIFGGVYAVENFEMDEIWVAPAKPSSGALKGVTYGTRTGSGTKENPTDTLTVAFAKAKPNATIYIVGDYDYTKMSDVYNAFNTPYCLEKLTIVGVPMVGTDANGETVTVAPALSVNSKYFYINSDTEFKNIELSYNDTEGGAALYIQCGYNNVTFADDFSTLGTSGALLVCGYMVYTDVYTAGRYSSVESISSDKDCVIDVKAGSFAFITGGNQHWAASTYVNAPYGTYSGNMVLNVDSDVVLKTSTAGMNGIVGMNYLTGTVTANLGAWHANKTVRDYCKIGSYSKYIATYNESNNTGSVIVNLGEGVDTTVTVSGDFNADGKVDLADTLLLVGYYMNGMDSAKKANFYDRTEVTMLHVLRAIKNLAK